MTITLSEELQSLQSNLDKLKRNIEEIGKERLISNYAAAYNKIRETIKQQKINYIKSRLNDILLSNKNADELNEHWSPYNKRINNALFVEYDASLLDDIMQEYRDDLFLNMGAMIEYNSED